MLPFFLCFINDTIMLYTINQLYEHLYQKVQSVYEVFKDFFGEDYVDFQPRLTEGFFKQSIIHKLQNLDIKIADTAVCDFPIELSDTIVKGLEELCANYKVDIYVWWPRVTVTNEYNKSINIKDLYAKIAVQLDGRIPYENRGFGLNRATYTKDQFLSNYMFSHIEGIPKGNFESFMLPCLGTGPINNTINTLKSSYDGVTWMLFCQELAMYVTVESIKGGPWRRLETVGSNSLIPDYSSGYGNTYMRKNVFVDIFSEETLKQFIKYYLENGHLSLNFKEGRFCCGMPYYDYIIDISNTFIDYFNEYIKNKRQLEGCFIRNLLKRVIVSDGKFYSKEDTDSNCMSLDYYRGKKVLTFKGKEILTTITEEEATPKDTTLTIVISHNCAMYVLYHILRTINYKYRNEYYHNRYDHFKNAPSYKRVVYI